MQTWKLFQGAVSSIMGPHLHLPTIHQLLLRDVLDDQSEVIDLSGFVMFRFSALSLPNKCLKEVSESYGKEQLFGRVWRRDVLQLGPHF